jgi:hypothetical protein
VPAPPDAETVLVWIVLIEAGLAVMLGVGCPALLIVHPTAPLVPVYVPFAVAVTEYDPGEVAEVVPEVE